MLAESKILQFHAFIVLQGPFTESWFWNVFAGSSDETHVLIVRTVDMLNFSYTRAGEHSTQCGIKQIWVV